MNNFPSEILFIIFDYCELDNYKSINLVNENWNWIIKKIIDKDDFKNKYVDFINYKRKLPLNTNKYHYPTIYTKFLPKDLYIKYFSSNIITCNDYDDYVTQNIDEFFNIASIYNISYSDNFLIKHSEFLKSAVIPSYITKSY